MWVLLCELNKAFIYRGKVKSYVHVSEMNFCSPAVWFSCCCVRPSSTLLSIHSPPLLHLPLNLKACGWVRETARLRWYPTANNPLLCTTCSLPISTAHPALVTICCPAKGSEWRTVCTVYMLYFCAFLSLLLLVYMIYTLYKLPILGFK